MDKPILDYGHLIQINDDALSEIAYNLFIVYGDCNNLYYDRYNDKLFVLFLAGKPKFSLDYFKNRGNYESDQDYVRALSSTIGTTTKIRMTNFIIVVDLLKFNGDKTPYKVLFIKDEQLKKENLHQIRKQHSDIDKSVEKNLLKVFGNYDYDRNITGFQYSFMMNLLNFKKKDRKIYKMSHSYCDFDTRFTKIFLAKDYLDENTDNYIHIPEDLKSSIDFFILNIRWKIDRQLLEILLEVVDDEYKVFDLEEKQYKIIQNFSINLTSIIVLEKIFNNLCKFSKKKEANSIRRIFHALKTCISLTNYYYEAKTLPF